MKKIIFYVVNGLIYFALIFTVFFLGKHSISIAADVRNGSSIESAFKNVFNKETNKDMHITNNFIIDKRIDEKDKFYNVLTKLPDKVSKDVLSQYTIYIDKDPLSDVLKNKYNIKLDHISGVTLKNRKVIHMNYKTDIGVLIHEIGHAFSNINKQSDSLKFKLLYKKEKDILGDSMADVYHKKNEDEFYADMFRRYIQEPNELKEKSPKLYKYFDNTLN